MIFGYSKKTIDDYILSAEKKCWNLFDVQNSLFDQPTGTIRDKIGNEYTFKAWDAKTRTLEEGNYHKAHNRRLFSALITTVLVIALATIKMNPIGAGICFVFLCATFYQHRKISILNKHFAEQAIIQGQPLAKDHWNNGITKNHPIPYDLDKARSILAKHTFDLNPNIDLGLKLLRNTPEELTNPEFLRFYPEIFQHLKGQESEKVKKVISQMATGIFKNADVEFYLSYMYKTASLHRETFLLQRDHNKQILEAPEPPPPPSAPKPSFFANLFGAAKPKEKENPLTYEERLRESMKKAKLYWENGPTKQAPIPNDIDKIRSGLQKFPDELNKLGYQGVILFRDKPEELFHPNLMPHFPAAFEQIKKSDPQQLGRVVGLMAVGDFENSDVNAFFLNIHQIAQNLKPK